MRFLHHLNILSYVFPVTEEFRQRLLGAPSFQGPFSICNSEVIFRYILLVPASHRRRLSWTFVYICLRQSFYTLSYYRRENTGASSSFFYLLLLLLLLLLRRLCFLFRTTRMNKRIRISRRTTAAARMATDTRPFPSFSSLPFHR